MTRSRLPRKTDLAPIVRAMLATFSLAVPAAAVAAGRIGAIEQGYALGRLQAQELSLARENQRLLVEVSTLRAPARLERLARERLHMASPGTGDLLREGGPREVIDLLTLAERR